MDSFLGRAWFGTSWVCRAFDSETRQTLHRASFSVQSAAMTPERSPARKVLATAGTVVLGVLTIILALLTYVVLLSWGGAGLLGPFFLVTLFFGIVFVGRLRRRHNYKKHARTMKQPGPPTVQAPDTPVASPPSP